MAPKMEDQQAPPPTIRRMAPKMWNQQGLTLDEQKCCAEDGGQAPTLDDQKHGAEDGGPAAADEQKPGAEDGGPVGADARRSDAGHRKWEISRR